MTVRDDLIAAKALIDTPEKWGKGGWAQEGCLCALGAVVMAVNGNDDFDNPWTKGVFAVDAQLEAQLPPPWNRVAEFNDHPKTTHADIMALFDRAIAACNVEVA